MEKQKKVVADQQDAQRISQAIKDDQGLSAVVNDIKVSVKDGTVTLDGQVATNQESNLAANTAAAVTFDDKVKNLIEIKHPSK